MLALCAKVVLATLALAVPCWIGAHWLLADWATQRFWWKLAWLLVTIAGGALTFLAAALLLRIPELEEVTRAVRRRLGRATR